MVSLLLPVIYLAFISLGLPDSLQGAAWPMIYPVFGVPVSYMGFLSFLISLGTILSSLASDRLTRRFGTGVVTAVSVALTAAALFGYSASGAFWQLCLWAIPYGLGAGSVDAALNNYVALHYASRHMSWLHCMWGVGTVISPMVLSAVLTAGHSWQAGYQAIALMQTVLTLILLCSLPLWQRRSSAASSESPEVSRALTLREVFQLPGAREVMLCFFCYCALETTAGNWASSYLTLSKGVPVETAAAFAGLFYGGITVGRAVCGFITFKLNDTQMIRLGQFILALGIGAGGGGLCAHLPQHHPLHPGALRGAALPSRHRHPDGQRLCGQSDHAAPLRLAGGTSFACSLPALSAGPAGLHGVDAPAAGTQDRFFQIKNIFDSGGIYYASYSVFG